jgi:cytochrome bd ubiquinol oxidase subunit II
MPDLPTIWFLLIGVLIGGYAVLDGFDLGAGILHLWVARRDEERRTVIASIGPVWDGNEVWLITFGGALFAAFALAYATVFSGFYVALMLLLLALIFRAVAIEFRDQEASRRWRSAWDVAFSLGSIVAALLLGVALGNIVAGLPLDADGQYRGGLVGLLRPFPLAVGLLTLALFAWHGSSWLVLKTGDDVQARARRARFSGLAATLVLWVAATAISIIDAPGAWGSFGQPLTWLAPLAFLAAVTAGWWFARARRETHALLASAGAILSLVAIVGISLYPDLVPSTGAGESITVAGAASSDLTLTVMLVITLLGMPLVLLYTGYVYSRFTGRVSLGNGYGH